MNVCTTVRLVLCSCEVSDFLISFDVLLDMQYYRAFMRELENIGIAIL